MFVCFCNKVIHQRCHYISHLKEHVQLGQLSMPLFCKQPNCDFKESFSDFHKLNNHLRRKHDNSLPNECGLISTSHLLETRKLEEAPCESMDFTEAIDNVDKHNLETFSDKKINISEIFKNLEKEIFGMIIGFKSKTQLSDKLLNEIIDSFSKLFGNSIDLITTLVIDSFRSENEYEQDKLNLLIQNISTLKSCFKFIDSSYKQIKLIESLNEYVKPEEILLGHRDDTVNKKGVIKMIKKNETFQYVNIIKTISSVLKIKKVRDQIKSFKNELSFDPITKIRS